MPSLSRDRFQALLRELSAEYDLVHAEVDVPLKAHAQNSELRCAASGVPLPDLRDLPGIPEVEATILSFEDASPSSLSDDSSGEPLPMAQRSRARQHSLETTFSAISHPAMAEHSSTNGGALSDKTKVLDAVRRMSTQEEEEKVATSFHKVMRSAKSLGPASFKESGTLAKIAKSKHFESFTLSMVILNGIWIAIDADHNPASFLLDAHPVFQVMEHLFCTVFSVELLIRFLAFRSKRDGLSDPWFMFDAVLVSMMVLETWIMTLVVVLISDGSGVGLNASVLRLLRLVRLSRLSRIIRLVPELCFMVKGVLQATRSVLCTIALLFGILYVFGIVLRLLSDGTNMGYKYFSSVHHSIFTLFAQVTLLDSISSLLLEVNRESTLCAFILLVVILLTAFTLMNMLVGVLCEVMNHVATSEKESMAISYVAEQIQLTLVELDTNLDQLISKEEFEHILLNPKAYQALRDVGVDVLALVDFADFFFQSDRHGDSFEKELSFDEFMAIIMQVRGMNAASVRDIVELRKFIHAEGTGRNATLRQLQDGQKTLARNQARLQRNLSSCQSPVK